jgi:hypothetical protein
MGLAALFAARLLKLPINAGYHTSLPYYAQLITVDGFMEDLAWKYTVWFYNQMDRIFISRQDDLEELIQKGISNQKIRLVPVYKKSTPRPAQNHQAGAAKGFTKAAIIT